MTGMCWLEEASFLAEMARAMLRRRVDQGAWEGDVQGYRQPGGVRSLAQERLWSGTQ